LLAADVENLFGDRERHPLTERLVLTSRLLLGLDP